MSHRSTWICPVRGTVSGHVSTVFILRPFWYLCRILILIHSHADILLIYTLVVCIARCELSIKQPRTIPLHFFAHSSCNILKGNPPTNKTFFKPTLVIHGNYHLKENYQGNFCGILIRWQANYLRLLWQNNSSMECRNRRSGCRTLARTHWCGYLHCVFNR